MKRISFMLATAMLCLIFAASAGAKEILFLEITGFPLGKGMASDVVERNGFMLQEVIDTLKQNPDAKAILTGYANAKRFAELHDPFNAATALSRAHAVRDYLQQRGIPNSQIVVQTAESRNSGAEWLKVTIEVQGPGADIDVRSIGSTVRSGSEAGGSGSDTCWSNSIERSVGRGGKTRLSRYNTLQHPAVSDTFRLINPPGTTQLYAVITFHHPKPDLMMSISLLQPDGGHIQLHIDDPDPSALGNISAKIYIPYPVNLLANQQVIITYQYGDRNNSATVEEIGGCTSQ